MNTKGSRPQKSPAKNRAPEGDLAAYGGLTGLIQLGLNSADERRAKNRIIFGLFLLLLVSISWNIVQSATRPEPKLLAETADGRIRPLPLLDDPIYDHKEILVWAEKCVSRLYRLSYVDWRDTLQNESMCLSDKGRQSFTKSLDDIGVFKYLNPQNQGFLYAAPKTPVMRQYRLSSSGYYEWIVDVPYRLNMDGRQKGTIDVVMSMKIRRVSMTWRDDGLWVESYVVRSANKGGA